MRRDKRWANRRGWFDLSEDRGYLERGPKSSGKVAGGGKKKKLVLRKGESQALIKCEGLTECDSNLEGSWLLARYFFEARESKSNRYKRYSKASRRGKELALKVLRKEWVKKRTTGKYESQKKVVPKRGGTQQNRIRTSKKSLQGRKEMEGTAGPWVYQRVRRGSGRTSCRLKKTGEERWKGGGRIDYS